VLLGGGKRYFPELTEHIRLRPAGTLEFRSGVRLLEYEVIRQDGT